MRRPPRDPRQGLFTPMLVWRVAFVALLALGGTFVLFAWERAHGADLAEARTVTVNTLVMIEIFYLFNARFLTAAVLTRRGLLGNPYIPLVVILLILAQLGFIYGHPLQELFGTAPIGGGAWLRSLGVGIAVLLAVEVEKTFIRRFRGGRRR